MQFIIFDDHPFIFDSYNGIVEDQDFLYIEINGVEVTSDGNSVTFTPNVSYNGEGTLSYFWNFRGLGTSTEQSPTIQIPGFSGHYPFTLVVTDGVVQDGYVVRFLRGQVPNIKTKGIIVSSPKASYMVLKRINK